ncbi:helix-turn-helix domain-containing protein [Providencia alcalifaciens]|uniref:helix-turn-helix domain-containing protein n=1 Tax=Providencia alcalifaciens TaxID=126385 RepID=UPI001CE0E8AB|nr:helix-turn-helix domain-containing protein [Providencia alcalifaciens]UBX48190.1 helix-turn-helix domain-containing protein [Providencia alcalifaciens]
MIFNEAIQTANHLIHLIPILGRNHSRQDYDDAIKLVEYLIEHDPDNPLVEILCTKIEDYEENASEFADFNRKLKQCDSAIAVLRTLMDQYGLNTTDFADEIGSRSYVSRILNGERSLSLEHMKKLAERFKLPISMFIK